MTTKEKAAPNTEPAAGHAPWYQSRLLKVPIAPKETWADALARASLGPTTQATLTLCEYNNTDIGEISASSLVEDLQRQIDRVKGGDLTGAESMLVEQAHTLDAIFHILVRRAYRANNIDHIDAFLRLGLRAQSQCRATLETLAAIKNPPPVAFVRQANIAHGPQQVNNSEALPLARGKSGNAQTELLEHDHGERLDTATAQAALRSHRPLETVAAQHRTAYARRKGRRQP